MSYFPKKTKPWSKLKSALKNLVDPNIKFDIHCSVHDPHDPIWPDYRNGRLWIVIGKEKIYRLGFPQQLQSRYMDL